MKKVSTLAFLVTTIISAQAYAQYPVSPWEAHTQKLAGAAERHDAREERRDERSDRREHKKHHMHHHAKDGHPAVKAEKPKH